MGISWLVLQSSRETSMEGKSDSLTPQPAELPVRFSRNK